MTLDQLRIFVAVAERQHVTHAAEALNLAQSAASHAIASLEDRHQTKLFNRIGRHIELTDAGQAFLKEARAVLAAVEAAELALIEFSNLKRGVLSVQASQTIANYWLPRHLAAFRSAYPQIEIRARIGNTAQVATAVENRETELGFVEAAIHSEQLTSAAVARDQIIVVTAPDHQLVKRKPITPTDLMEVEWVLRERGSGTRSVFEDAPRSLVLRLERYASPWNCPQMKRCARPPRLVWEPQLFRLRSRPLALKPASYSRSIFVCLNVSSMC